MRQKVTMTKFICDICKNEFEEDALFPGKVVLPSSEKRFDICKDDLEKFLGDVEDSPRMGRGQKAA